MPTTNEKKARVCFLTVVLYSLLTATYIQIENYEFDILLFFTTIPFLIYIVFFWVRNPVFRKIFIALEGIYMLLLFFVVLTLSNYNPGEYLLELFLLITHSFVRLYGFLIVSKSKHALLKAVIVSIIISFSLYFYGSTEYLRIM
jgi:hypothetical protein